MSANRVLAAARAIAQETPAKPKRHVMVRRKLIAELRVAFAEWDAEMAAGRP